MAPTADDEPTGRKYDASLARRLIQYVRPYRLLVVGALVLIAIESAAQLVGPLLTKRVIDVAWPERDAAHAVQLAALFALSLLVQFAASFGETMLTSLLGQRVMRDLRNQLFERLDRKSVV